MRKSLVVSSVLSLLALSSGAQAQQLPASAKLGLADGFSIQQFDPAYAGDRFFGVQNGNAVGDKSFKPMLLANYALRPLKVQDAQKDTEVGVITSNQLYAHLDGSFTLWNRLALNIDLPFALVQSGDSNVGNGAVPSTPSGGKLSDIRLGARYSFFSYNRGMLDLGVQADLYLPTGSKDSLAGDGKFRGHPRFVASGKAGSFVYAANIGVLIRKHLDLGSGEIGNALSFGFAAGMLFLDDKLQVGPELYGNTVFSAQGSSSPFLGSHSSPIEAILGAKMRFSSIVAGAGIGPGFTAAVGSPALRVLASVTWAPESKAPEDRDGDGILDQNDACPDEKGVASDDPKKHGCPVRDRDKDGILDADDACIDVPGVKTSDPKTNGCPAPIDTDGDGIFDPEDRCPKDPGPPNTADPSKHGCPPPPDRDKDGIIDAEDACIDVPGVKSTDPKMNGCPGDTDGDGIFDDKDACPQERGPADPDPKKNGCPGAVRVVGDEIIILQQVQFDTSKATIKKVSDPLLDDVAAVLRDHPEITKIQIEGHTDSRGGAAANKKLSQDRANAVLKAIVTRRIEAGRLTAVGFGQEQPVADNNTEDGRAKNRRVQFKIIERKKK